jgi:uncharacterized protein (DUF302 family)
MQTMTPAYALEVKLALTHAQALDLVRERLVTEGFTILNETDLAATLRGRIGEEIGPHVILGVCSAPLAFRAIQADRAAGVLLPCTVEVRADTDGHAIVAALNPVAALGIAGNDALNELAADASARLQRVLDHLDEHHAAPQVPAAVENAEELC